MHCYECKKAGRNEEAIGLCANCSVGLCLRHLREYAQSIGGQTWFSCPHDAMARPKGSAARTA